MADIPTISQLKTDIENDLKTELGISRNWVGKVFLKALASVWAGVVKLVYLRIAGVQKNIFVDTADPESQGGTLERFGRVKIERNPLPAQAGVYEVDVTGTVGATIDRDTTFKSTINSVNPDYLFVTDQDYTLTSSPQTIKLRALTPGSESELAVSDEVEATSPIDNVDSTAIVSAIDTDPVNAETIETYRRLVEEAFKLEPQGGSPTDYRLWAADVQGVRTVYTYTKYDADAPFNVAVYVEALPDNSAPGESEGVAPALMISNVEAAIESGEDRARRPINHWITVESVTPVDVDITISNLTDQSSETIDNIELALKDLLYTVRPYIAAADGIDKSDVLTLSSVIVAVNNQLAVGETFTAISMDIKGVERLSYTFSNIPNNYGEYPILGNLNLS